MLGNREQGRYRLSEGREMRRRVLGVMRLDRVVLDGSRLF